MADGDKGGEADTRPPILTASDAWMAALCDRLDQVIDKLPPPPHSRRKPISRAAHGGKVEVRGD